VLNRELPQYIQLQPHDTMVMMAAALLTASFFFEPKAVPHLL